MFRNQVKGHAKYPAPYEAAKEDQSDAIKLSSQKDAFFYKAVNFYRYRPDNFTTDALDPSRGARAERGAAEHDEDGEENQLVIKKLTERRIRRSPCVTNTPTECRRHRRRLGI